MQKGKLGSSKNAVRLALFPMFPFEEAGRAGRVGGREATAVRRWQGHCQGLLRGVSMSAGLVGWGTRAGWREVARPSRGVRNRETPRGDVIFLKPSCCRADGCS